MHVKDKHFYVNELNKVIKIQVLVPNKANMCYFGSAQYAKSWFYHGDFLASRHLLLSFLMDLEQDVQEQPPGEKQQGQSTASCLTLSWETALEGY